MIIDGQYHHNNTLNETVPYASRHEHIKAVPFHHSGPSFSEPQTAIYHHLKTQFSSPRRPQKQTDHTDRKEPQNRFLGYLQARPGYSPVFLTTPPLTSWRPNRKR